MRVLIAGVAANSGRMLAERLLAMPGVESVIGLDEGRCTPPVPGLHFVRAPYNQPEWTAQLSSVDAVVLLMGLHWPRRRQTPESALVANSKAVVQAALGAGVSKIVVAQSAALYGAQPPGPLTESAPLRGQSASAYARARAQMSDFLVAIAPRFVQTTITELRAAWICGPHHMTPIRVLTGQPVLVCGAEERVLQVVHEDDLVTALLLTLAETLPGAYNVAPDDGVSFRDLASLLGDSRACMPLAGIVLRAWWEWRWRGQPVPPDWTRSLYRACMLDAGRLRTAGWTPAHGTRATLTAALAAYRT